MARIKTDLCIIGAGSGGLSLAAGAAQMGADCVLVEGAEMGGDCLNTGCVPSKALLAAAKMAQSRREGAGLGVMAVDPVVNFAAVQAHVQRVIAQIAPVDSQERFEGLGVRVIRAWGAFVSPNELQAGGDIITARRFVIATGSHPVVPDLPGLNGVRWLTNETIFTLQDRPDHLIILGGGPIGVEMAQAHRRLGSQVTVIARSRVLGRDDAEAAALVVARLRVEGVTVLEDATVSHVSGAVEVTLADGRVIAGSHLLLALGRKPALARLNLTAAGVAVTERGVKVDGRLCSSNRRIYALGDVAGGRQFTHVAGYQAGIVLRQVVLGLPARERTDHIPWVTYTDPELAQIGPTEAEARATHGDGADRRARRLSPQRPRHHRGQQDGFIKVMIVKGRPIGVTIVAHAAGELIGLWALVDQCPAEDVGRGGYGRRPIRPWARCRNARQEPIFPPSFLIALWSSALCGLVQAWLP